MSRYDIYMRVILNLLAFSILNGPILHTPGGSLPFVALGWIIAFSITFRPWEKR